MALAVFFFFHGTQKVFGWFGGDGWQGTVALWTDPNGLSLSYAMIAIVMVAEVVVSIGLFFGILTRIAAAVAVLIMAGSLFYIEGGLSFEAVELPLVVIAAGLALIFMGGGLLSLDRSLSTKLLPHVG